MNTQLSGEAVAECQDVGTFREFNEDGILSPIGVVVFSQLRTKPPRLNADHGIYLRVEVCRASEDLSRNLVFLDGRSRMVQGMLSEISK